MWNEISETIQIATISNKQLQRSKMNQNLHGPACSCIWAVWVNEHWTPVHD